jgi:D-3-phosphoglycerate dehydrogenase
MLALSKCIFKMDRAVREGNFAIRNRYLPVDLQNKTLGLVGFGRIGKSVAQICSICFNMKIIFYDPFLNNDIKLDFNSDRVYDIEEIFMRSDYISLHIPYNSQNHHLIDMNLLKKMKPDSFLVNTSRGGIICENALAECLISGRITGAALDVFEDEPPESDSPLLKIDNVILSPHSAALTREGSKRIAMHAVQGVADVLEGKIPKWIFNRNNIKLL